MCTIRTCKRFRIAAKILQVTNTIAAIISGFMLYGSIGRIDYASLYHTAMTKAEENSIWLQAAICMLLLVAFSFFAVQFGTFAEWLDDVIAERRYIERRERERRIVLAHRREMKTDISV